MKERGILFSGAMVRAILEGRKTQTRRVCKLNSAGRVELLGRNWHVHDKAAVNACPYGLPGDRLWVRETWAKPYLNCDPVYRADYKGAGILKWKPSIFMPIGVSRINLEIVNVRVERLKDMTAADAVAEGITDYTDENEVWSYAQLWNSINGKKYPWSSNPWVWVIEFKRI